LTSLQDFRGFPEGERSGRRTSARRRLPAKLIVGLVVCVAAILATSGSALAQTGHKFLTQLTSAPLGTPLSHPEAVATDEAGNVYVGDSSAGGIDVFDSGGKFKAQFGASFLAGIPVVGIAVDSSGKVYVATLEHCPADESGEKSSSCVLVFKPGGIEYTLVAEWSGAKSVAKAFSEIGGIGIDRSTSGADPRKGDVYVLDKPNLEVEIIKPGADGEESELVSTIIGKPTFEESEDMALAVRPSNGQVYVSDLVLEKPSIEEFSNTGAFVKKFNGLGTPTKSFAEILTMAVDDGNGDLYVLDVGNHAVDQFTEAGEWLGWITNAEPSGTLTHFGEPLGVAVGAGGDVYVSDGASAAVDVYGPGVTVPAVASAKATKIERTAAILNGSITVPKGQEASYFFEYHEILPGEKEGPRLTTAVTKAPEGESKPQATIEGLKAGQEYAFRLVVTTENGATEGAIEHFTAAPAVAKLETGFPTGVTATSATLTGTLTPQKFPTKYRFEYGETAELGKATPFEGTTSGPAILPEAQIEGLKPNTRYHYRLMAFNEFGTTFGEIVEFKTTGPSITGISAEPLSHTSEKIHATIDPDKIAKSKYHIDYGLTTAYGTSTPEHEIPGESAVAIEEELKGLKLATTYHYRVVVTNEQGTSNSPDQTFTTVLIDSESAPEVGAEAAVLQAGINPFGVHTTAHFEYGETTSYGTSVPVPDEDLGSGTEDRLMQVSISGLHPGTTYHYRVVATVAGIEEKGLGADHTFTAGVATPFHLPDGRGYEMVSPANKHGSFIPGFKREGGLIQAATDGTALTYTVEGTINEEVEGNRSFEPQQTLAIRSPGGWASQEIVTPSEHALGVRLGVRTQYQQFSPDLALAALQPFPFALTPLAEPPLAPPATEAERGHQEKTVYVRDNAPITPSESERALYEKAKANGEQFAAEGTLLSAGYFPLVSDANVLGGTHFGGEPHTGGVVGVEPAILFKAASPDLSHSVIQSRVPLTADAVGAKSLELLYDASSGKLSLVSILPADEGGGVVGGQVGQGKSEKNLRNTVTNSGRVMWTHNESEVHSSAAGRLYLRDTAKQQTLRLDVAEEGLTQPEHGQAQFQDASADGSRVFFSDPQRLTAFSTATTEKPDLYVCEVKEVAGALSCSLTDLSVDANVGESANVKGITLGSAADGSSIYFVASGALAPGAQSGKFNLYVAQAAGGWQTKFVATLSVEDMPDWGLKLDPQAEKNQEPRVQTASVSPSGNWLAFMSDRPLTGYDNTDVNEVVGKGEPTHRHADEEVFLYDAGNNTITCASCNPSGARPRGVFDQDAAGEGRGLLVDRGESWGAGEKGGTAGPADHWLAGSIPSPARISTFESLYRAHILSDEGRLFFTSADALTPAATGHTRTESLEGGSVQVGVENVYQWEPNGVGSCALASGCVSLITNGSSNQESMVLDASLTGNDVFMLTNARQDESRDTDGVFDIYDARVCGPEGCLPPAPTPAEVCSETETCRPGSFAPPGSGSPASSTFSGPGNALHEVPSGEVLNEKVKQKPPLTTAQKLAAALKKCRKLPHRTRAQKHKRATCEAQAHKKYKVKKASAHKAAAHRSAK
jgi:hypothetical protein